jgi:hypothetical protein
MLNHLIWFLESAVDEDQGEQCQYSPGSSFYTRHHRPARTNQGGRRRMVETEYRTLSCLLRHRDAAASQLGSTFLSLDHNFPCDVRRQPGPKIIRADPANDNDGKNSECHHLVRGVAERSQNRSDDPLKTVRRHVPTHTAKLPSAPHCPKTWMGKH